MSVQKREAEVAMKKAVARPRLLAVEEVAEILGVCPMTCWNLVCRGELKSVKVGRLRRFDLADVEAYIEDGKKPDKLPSRGRRRARLFS
jgi:excisionase family DNA binding protein